MKDAHDNISANKTRRASCFENPVLQKHIIEARGEIN